MIGHRCKNCIWWDNQHPSINDVPLELGKTELGFCRRRKSGAVKIGLHFFGIHPIMDGSEFCGEFKGSG